MAWLAGENVLIRGNRPSVYGIKEGIGGAVVSKQETSTQEFHVGCSASGLAFKRGVLIVKTARGMSTAWRCCLEWLNALGLCQGEQGANGMIEWGIAGPGS